MEYHIILNDREYRIYVKTCTCCRGNFKVLMSKSGSKCIDCYHKDMATIKRNLFGIPNLSSKNILDGIRSGEIKKSDFKINRNHYNAHSRWESVKPKERIVVEKN